jgi:hypothetical protein
MKGGTDMDHINDLILSASAILDNGFDVGHFAEWRESAFIVLLGLLGPFHYYTRNFGELTAGMTQTSLLAGSGVLVAVEHGIRDGKVHTTLGVPFQGNEASFANIPWLTGPKKWHPASRLPTLAPHALLAG